MHSCTVCDGYPHDVQRRIDAAGRKHATELATIRAAQDAGRVWEPVQTHLAGATWRAAEAAL